MLSYKILFFILQLYLLFERGCHGCLQDETNVIDSSFDVFPHLNHISKFSLDLFKEILTSHSKENLFLSPFTVWNGLALTYLGSEGRSKEQLENVLGVHSKSETLKMWRAADYLYKMRQLQFNESHFGVVNRAYFQSGLPLKSCIKEILHSDLQMIDFNQPKLASSIINEFISSATGGHIKSVTRASDLIESQMALVNAAFFKDSWKFPFKKSETEEALFYNFGEDPKIVKMMKSKGQFKHGVSRKLGAHVLELPYAMKDLSMFVFLPPFLKGKEGLDSLLQNMTVPVVEEAIQNVYLDNIDIAIPKMSLATSLGPELKEALQRLGIKDIFDSKSANLSSFVPEGGISVTSALHQTYLETNEEGTEAAATAVVIGTGRSARPSRQTSFICDHPFVFLIYDKITKNILFMGVYRD